MNNQTITSDPTIMMGKPVIAGTRITVELILRKLGAGESFEQIIDSHPRLTRESIFEALRFASNRLGSEIARLISGCNFPAFNME
jgi:uncharacterized protein (DUF433 family)